ncbi:MAG: hypothetical protein RLZZ127_746 [Planctomycetota bacterium]|jgi:hypothetical protein
MPIRPWSVLPLLLALAGMPAPAVEDGSTPAAAAAPAGAAIVDLLARRVWPAEDGAMGRNRRGWFHARFQMGLHHLARQAVERRDPAAADAYVRALALAFAHQGADGGFLVRVPDALAGAPAPRATDLASGSAFFLASAGDGWWALEQSPWFQTDPAGAALRGRLADLRPALRRAADHLARLGDALQVADGAAPNRLLFDALALRSCGLLLADPALVARAAVFRDAAIALVDPGGWFIEGGGHDSSYNAVACAVALRLRASGDDDPRLEAAIDRAMAWQHTRIRADGSVDLAGNTRVRAEGGESFLGQEKGMDIPHLVEALLLDGRRPGRSTSLAIAERVIAHARGGRPAP